MQKELIAHLTVNINERQLQSMLCYTASSLLKWKLVLAAKQRDAQIASCWYSVNSEM
jgi:hypothetical protein